MSFEEHVAAFHMAFAENKLEEMCDCLFEMRSSVVQRKASASSGSLDAMDDVFEEMLRACEIKAETKKSLVLDHFRGVCAQNDDLEKVLAAFCMCELVGSGADEEPEVCDAMGHVLVEKYRQTAKSICEQVLQSKTSASVNEHGYIDRQFYVQAMNDLLTIATELMNALADLVSRKVIRKRILWPMHEKCIQTLLEVLQLYALEARIAAWERRAIDMAKRQLNEMEIESDESLQMVDLFLDEFAFVIALLSSYQSFVTNCILVEDSPSGSPTKAAKDQPQRDPFELKIQELQGVYLLLERFYIFQSVHKATKITEVQQYATGIYVCSLVEDVSFVLNKALYRASQCQNSHTTLSIVIAIVDVLESMYLAAIVDLPNRDWDFDAFENLEAEAKQHALEHEQKSPKAQHQEVSLSDLLVEAVDQEFVAHRKQEQKLLMAINSAYLSKQFLDELEKKVPKELVVNLPKQLHEITSIFEEIVPNEIQQILLRKGGILESFERLVKVTMAHTNFVFERRPGDDIDQQEGADQVSASSEVAGGGMTRGIGMGMGGMMSLGMGMISSGFGSASNTPPASTTPPSAASTSPNSGEREGSETLIEADVAVENRMNVLISKLVEDKKLLKYHNALLADPFDGLMEFLMEHVAQWLEQAILRNWFDELGALQLETQVGKLISALETLLQSRENQQQVLKQKCTRLFQVIQLLNLFQPKDVLEYEQITQQMTPEDICAVLKRRKDFDVQQIDRLFASS